MVSITPFGMSVLPETILDIVPANTEQTAEQSVYARYLPPNDETIKRLNNFQKHKVVYFEGTNDYVLLIRDSSSNETNLDIYTDLITFFNPTAVYGEVPNQYTIVSIMFGDVISVPFEKTLVYNPFVYISDKSRQYYPQTMIYSALLGNKKEEGYITRFLGQYSNHYTTKLWCYCRKSNGCQLIDMCLSKDCIDLYYNPRHIACADCGVIAFRYRPLCENCSQCDIVCMRLQNDCICDLTVCTVCEVELGGFNHAYVIDGRNLCKFHYITYDICIYCGEYLHNWRKSDYRNIVNAGYYPTIIDRRMNVMLKYGIEGAIYVKKSGYCNHTVIEDSYGRYTECRDCDVSVKLISDLWQKFKQTRPKEIEKYNSLPMYDTSSVFDSRQGIPDFVDENIATISYSADDIEWCINNIPCCADNAEIFRIGFNKEYGIQRMLTHVDCFRAHNKNIKYVVM